MASFHNFVTTLYSFLIFSASLNTITGAFVEEVSKARVINREEKTTHLHFFFHDVLGGNHPTALRIAGPPESTISDFGNTMIIDNALTEEADPTSKLVGRAQGLYSMASQNDVAFLMVVNFAFMEDKYKGSSISMIGRNPVANDVREMPIVGGSGLFRNSRGYALAHTNGMDPSTGNAIVEYNVYVSNFELAATANTATANAVDASLATREYLPWQYFFILFFFGLYYIVI
ncbi:dirigent protein 22-like [Corylus avellana]|uniref:dirigent protein 22-like n=1 Tax=Corylus avellana TaxID=13451 RepID=UPI001E208376|nr:dirigent protein 22-like [Corylus avellana]